ncbi:MAG: hypothetical protein R3321_13435 [Nitrososphaeraceae archaeon]|nr:hypothetical protein [Nitrososphaeraceae archaeon]
MKETVFTKKFVDHMKKKFPYMWAANIHGHEMQRSSLPDYLFCINSIFTAIEFKVQRDYKISITPLQVKEINDIKNSNGIGLIIAWDENWDRILIRERRLDWKKIKKGYTKIDWDFDYVNYEDAMDLLEVFIGAKL